MQRKLVDLNQKRGGKPPQYRSTIVSSLEAVKANEQAIVSGDHIRVYPQRAKSTDVQKNTTWNRILVGWSEIRWKHIFDKWNNEEYSQTNSDSIL